jgi:ribosomal-protein-alanine N-acetyltransferase
MIKNDMEDGLMNLQFETERLILRPFQYSDASKVYELADDYEVARTTLSIPHPYPEGAAESWIRACEQSAKEGNSFAFAMERKEDGALLGCMSIGITKPHQRGEIAYWVGKPYWGYGYATEAARRIVQFGFEDLGLNRIVALAMTKNPASTKVMSKIGMKYEGKMPQQIFKWDHFEDIAFYGLLKSDYLQMHK